LRGNAGDRARYYPKTNGTHKVPLFFKEYFLIDTFWFVLGAAALTIWSATDSPSVMTVIAAALTIITAILSFYASWLYSRSSVDSSSSENPSE